MDILIDTNIFILSINSPDKLLPKHRNIIDNEYNNLYLSSLSIAEISIKKSIGKIDIEFDLDKMSYDVNLKILDFKASEASILEQLPLHHKDPFDRMIIAQAIVNDYFVITTDKKFSYYEEVKLL